MGRVLSAVLACGFMLGAGQVAAMTATYFDYTYFRPSSQITYYDWSEPPGSGPTIIDAGTSSGHSEIYAISYWVEGLVAENPLGGKSISKSLHAPLSIAGVNDFVFYYSGTYDPDSDVPARYGFDLTFDASGDIVAWYMLTGENHGYGDLREHSSTQKVFSSVGGVSIGYYDALLAEIYTVSSHFAVYPGYWTGTRTCYSEAGEFGDPVDCTDPSDEVAHVPLPAAGWGLLGGLGGLVCLRRRAGFGPRAGPDASPRGPGGAAVVPRERLELPTL